MSFSSRNKARKRWRKCFGKRFESLNRQDVEAPFAVYQTGGRQHVEVVKVVILLIVCPLNLSLKLLVVLYQFKHQCFTPKHHPSASSRMRNAG